MSKCQCSMTGDGCRYCQPQKYIGWMSEWLQESQEKASSLEEERDTLRKQLDEARELLAVASEIIHEQAIHIDRPMTDLGSEALTRLDDWLEANKV